MCPAAGSANLGKDGGFAVLLEAGVRSLKSESGQGKLQGK